MKRLLAVLAVGLVIPLATITGCVPGLKATKTPASPKQPPGAKLGQQPSWGPAAPGGKKTENAAGETPSEKSSPTSPKEWEKTLPPPPPSYKKRKSQEATRALPASPKELLEKEDINASALEFAKEIPNVKHVKTCFSKMFGGWYLLLYVARGKKLFVQHYTWNSDSKEWDVTMAGKEVPQKNLEYQLKTEVGDEKCTLLK